MSFAIINAGTIFSCSFTLLHSFILFNHLQHRLSRVSVSISVRTETQTIAGVWHCGKVYQVILLFSSF